MNALTGATGQLFFNTTYNHMFRWSTDRWWPVGLPDPRYGFAFQDDFTGATNTSQSSWLAAGTVNITAGNATNPGIFTVTQATAASRSIIQLQPNAILFGSADYYFEALVSIPTLATAGEDFIASIGFNDTGAFDGGGACTDGAYFRYNRGVNGVNWQTLTTSNTSATTTNTSTAIVAATYYRLTIVVTGSTQVDFYVNGTKIDTIISNIPSGAGRQTGPLLKIDKIAGTGASSLTVDYVSFYAFFGSARST
jgi:hypothetical protein